MTDRSLQHITAIADLIRTGTAEQALLAALGKRFAELSPAELCSALQDATTMAEKQTLVGTNAEWTAWGIIARSTGSSPSPCSPSKWGAHASRLPGCQTSPVGRPAGYFTAAGH